VKTSRVSTPVLFVDATDAGITAVGLGGRRARAGNTNDDSSLARRWRMLAKKELQAFFFGRLRFFSTPYDLRNMPPFTRAVLRVTAQIPYGKVRSYQWIAERLGKPKASRAVGNALARNPIPIIIPCHRVVRSDGTLGGYALGLSWKRRLLDLEKRNRGRLS